MLVKTFEHSSNKEATILKSLKILNQTIDTFSFGVEFLRNASEI